MELEPVSGGRDHGQHDQGDKHPQDPDETGGRDILDRADRCHEDIEQVPCPDILEKRDGHTLLGTEKHIPEDHPADEEADTHREGPALFAQVNGEESPDEQIDERPENEFHEPDRMPRVEEKVTEHEGGNGLKGKGHDRRWE